MEISEFVEKHGDEAPSVDWEAEKFMAAERFLLETEDMSPHNARRKMVFYLRGYAASLRDASDYPRDMYYDLLEVVEALKEKT